MKKIVLSLAGVLAATAFAPEASAIPAFARQTGMACAACHFQSYPALTGFGKAFKTSGFTMMGAQGKIEGEHGLSIPNTLNMAVYMQARYIKTNGSDLATAAPAALLAAQTAAQLAYAAAPTAATLAALNAATLAAGAGNANNNLSTNSGRIDVPDEMSLFAAGRVAENIGAMAEVNIGGATAGLAAAKFPIMFDVGSVKLGVIPFTNGNGPAWGYDQFATGSVANARVTENGGGYSAAMMLGTTGAGFVGGNPASGAAIVVANETFHVNYTPWAWGHAASNSGATATKLGGNYLRAAWTPNYANWDLGLGVQHFSGNALKGINTAGLLVNGIPAGAIDAAGNTNSATKATILDFQGQGEVAAMPLGIYGSYGWAPGSPGVAAGATWNIYNFNPERASAFGLLADLGVIPNTLNLQFGFMRNKTGANVAAVAGTNESDNSYTIGARYKLAQNVKAAFAYTKSTGSAYNTNAAGVVIGTAPNAGRGAGSGNSLATFILSTGF